MYFFQNGLLLLLFFCHDSSSWNSPINPTELRSLFIYISHSNLKTSVSFHHHRESAWKIMKTLITKHAKSTTNSNSRAAHNIKHPSSVIIKARISCFHFQFAPSRFTYHFRMKSKLLLLSDFRQVCAAAGQRVCINLYMLHACAMCGRHETNFLFFHPTRLRRRQIQKFWEFFFRFCYLIFSSLEFLLLRAVKSSNAEPVV